MSPLEVTHGFALAGIPPPVGIDPVVDRRVCVDVTASAARCCALLQPLFGACGLNHLQVELLHRHRSGKTDDRVKRGIHLTINGLAAGLRNSG